MTQKKLSYAALIVIIIGCVGYLYASEDIKPRIEIVTKDIDIGDTEKGALLDFKVEVMNAGKADLVIENVYSSCGCFEVRDPRWPGKHDQGKGVQGKSVIIKPNKSIFIATRLDTNKVSGKFEKILHIVSNDPERKDAIWRIKGSIQPMQLETKPESRGTISKDAKVVMLFYTPGCNECSEIRDKFLPIIKDKYKDKILIVEYNIDNPESFAFLIDLQDKYDPSVKKGFFNPKPPAVFVENRLLYGVKAITEKLEKILNNFTL